MSEVVTPPPRPPRPYLPGQAPHSAKDDTKLAPNGNGGAKNEPPSGICSDTSSKPEILHQSYTFSSSNDRQPHLQHPARKHSAGSQSSSEREISSPERQLSPSSSKTVKQLVPQHTRLGSPPIRSLSTGTKDDLETRRWSYGFESVSSSRPAYRPRPPPPPPASRQLSSSESNKNSMETYSVSKQEDDIYIRRRSYTYGSAKSFPSYPTHRTRQSSWSSNETEGSASSKRQTSPGPSMGTVMEKSHSAGSSLNRSTPIRPSRPPLPKAKTLPKSASLTTYRNQRDGVSLLGKQHSRSTTDGHTVTRPLSPQQDPTVPSTNQPHVQQNEKNVTETNRLPDNVDASGEVPVIPPRPVRPPRPFPPGKGGSSSSGRSKWTQRKPAKQSPNHSVDRTPKHSQDFEQQTITNSKIQDETSPEIVTNPPPASDDPVAPSSQDFSQVGIQEPTVSAQEQLNAQNFEGPANVKICQSRSLVNFSNIDQIITPSSSSNVDEEGDQVSPLPESGALQSRGSRFIFSMKKSFRSLRSPNRNRKQPILKHGRPHSETTLSLPEDRNKYPDPLPQGIINPIVIRCVAYLNKESVLKEEGLFRIPGDVAAIKQLREKFIAGFDVDLSEVVDPHTVAGLLKLHFREQRFSMIPRGQPLSNITRAVKDKDVESVREVIKSIDVSNTAMLRVVAELLTMVASYSEENKMSSGTLATSCAPSMFPYLPTSSAVLVMKFLIDHCSEIFQQ